MKTGEITLEIMRTAGWYNDWLLRQIKKYLSGDILEVGAGIGNFTKGLSMYGKVTAIDYDKAYKNANFGDIEKGKYFFGRERKFDTIVCMNVLEHIKDDGKALGNMYKLLRKGGKLILLVPAFPFAYGILDSELGHYRRYTRESIGGKTRRAGFKIIGSKYLNWVGLVGWSVNAKISGRKILPEWQLKIFDKIARPFLAFEEVVGPAFGLSVLVIGQKK